MAKAKSTNSFPIAAGDPLAAELSAVSAWIDDALERLGEELSYQDLDLKELPSGAKLLAGDAEQSRRNVLAALAQVAHWDRLADEIRNTRIDEIERVNPYHLPGWSAAWGRRVKAQSVISALMRRNLPFDRSDLLTILKWCSAGRNLSSLFSPLGAITKALQRYAEKNSLDPELQQAVKQFATCLRSAHDKDAKRLGTTVEQLCPDGPAVAEPDNSPPAQPPPQPAPAGSPQVMVQLKQLFEMASDEEAESTVLEPDRFALCTASPLVVEHDLLSALFNEVVGKAGYHQPDLKALKSGRALLKLPPLEMGRAILAAAERHVNALLSTSVDYNEHATWQSRYTATSLCGLLSKHSFEVTREEAFDLLLYLAVLPTHQRNVATDLAPRVLRAIHLAATKSPLTEGERYVLSLYRAAQISGPPLGAPAEEVTSLTALIEDGAAFYLVPGEAWTDTVNAELSPLSAERRTAWIDLLRHALTATAARPSAKWINSAEKLIQAVGGKDVRTALANWFPLVAKGQTIRKLASYAGDTRGGSDTMHEENANCLRGLLWCVPLLPEREVLIRAVTGVALSAYKKVPGVGPRAVKVGNASVYALSELASKEAVGQWV